MYSVPGYTGSKRRSMNGRGDDIRVGTTGIHSYHVITAHTTRIIHPGRGTTGHRGIGRKVDVHVIS